MLSPFTLRILDQIRVNGFEVDILDAAGAGGIDACLVSESGAEPQRFPLVADGSLRRLAERYCTAPQVSRLFAGRGGGGALAMAG